MRKRTIKPLPEAQKETLLEMYRYHPKPRMRERAHMVLLSSQKRSIKEICSIVFRSENTVRTWLNSYEKIGFLGLYDGDIPGRPPRLDKDQQEQIAKWLDDSPRKEGYQQSFLQISCQSAREGHFSPEAKTQLFIVISIVFSMWLTDRRFQSLDRY